MICYRTQKTRGRVTCANSELYTVEVLNPESVTLRRQMEEVDRDAGRTRETMPTLDLPYDELLYRFRCGYCITVHNSQGKTIREPYTIHDWAHPRMSEKAKYVALSRGTVAEISDVF